MAIKLKKKDSEKWYNTIAGKQQKSKSELKERSDEHATDEYQTQVRKSYSSRFLEPEAPDDFQQTTIRPKDPTTTIKAPTLSRINAVKNAALDEDRKAGAYPKKSGNQLSALEALEYGSTRTSQGLAGSVVNPLRWIGSTAYKIPAIITSLGGLAPNRVSNWLNDKAESYYDDRSIASAYDNWRTATDNKFGDKLNDAQRFVGDIEESGAAMLPSLLIGTGVASKAGQFAGDLARNAMFGASAAGSATKDAYNASGDFDKSYAFGVLSGTLETMTENLAGGIPQGNKGFIGKLLTRLDKVPGAVKTLADIVGEGGEEVISEVLTPYLARLTYDPSAEDATIEDIARAFASGALLSGIMEGANAVSGSISNTIDALPAAAQTNRYGKQIVAADAQDALLSEALESAPETQSYVLANEYKNRMANGDGISNRQWGRLAQANERAIFDEQNTTASNEDAARLLSLSNAPEVDGNQAAPVNTPRVQTNHTGAYQIDRFESAIAPENIGKKGVAAFSDMNEGLLPAQDFTAQFSRFYDAGRLGVSMESLPENIYENAFSPAQAQQAYNAGANDAQPVIVSEENTVVSDTKNAVSEGNIINPTQNQDLQNDLNGDMMGPEGTPQLSDAAKTPAGATSESPSSAAVPVAKKKSNKTAPTARASGNPSLDISNKLLAYIGKGVPFTPAKLYELSDEAFGGSMAEGKYTIKDAYDAMELSVNRVLLDSAEVKSGNADSVADARKTLSYLDSILSNIVTQTKRTQEQEQFQQFSTPPSIAYIAGWAAKVNSKDTVLEPSAGIGGLSVFPKAWGAKVIVNELSNRRLSVLKNLPFDAYYNENAEHINDILPDTIKPTVVIMNPPFSSDAGRTGKNKTMNATMHIESALARLPSGGRLVAILGKGMSDDAASFQSWWKKIKSENNVRANLSIDGKNYAKYGTTWGIQLVVIDKGGKTDKTITGKFDSLADSLNVLEEVRNARQSITENAGDQLETSGESVHERFGKVRKRAGGQTGRAVARDTDTRDVDTGRVPGMGRDAESGGRGLPESGRGDGSVSGVLPTDGRAGAVRGTRDAGSRAGRRGRGNASASVDTSGMERRGTGADVSSAADVQSHHASGDGGLRRVTPAAAVPNTESEVRKLEANIDNTYSPYAPKKVAYEGARKHPAILVESAAMSAVEPPDVTYTPNLPQSIITSGTLSDAQLEAVTYAGQAHSQMLPDGRRRGFFIGDGTGVGKGREICGVIMDNWRNGRTKAIWVTKSDNLYPDAVRDWVDLGGNKKDIIRASSLKSGKPIKADSGIILVSYNTLRSGSKDGRTRMDAFSSWLGKDFDGVIVFDESHQMGNAIDIKLKRGKKEASKRAIAGVEFQDALKDARVLYASATGATEVANLSYLTRLGLWGEGTSFHDVRDFVTKIKAGGLGAMELVARDMKSMGDYIARNISYDGVQYETLTHGVSEDQRTIYNTMSGAWQSVMQNIEKALSIINAGKGSKERTSAYSAFYGALQRFYNQILTSMSMPSVISDIKTQLAEGRSVVLQIVNTNEAAQDRELSKAEQEQADLDALDLTPRESLVSFLKASFPVNLNEEYTDDNGNTKYREVKDSAGNPVISKEAVRLRDALIEQINEMSVPEGPIESLLNEFGADAVAEITGRQRRVVRRGDGTIIVESRSQTAVEADAQAFQDGKKRILIFSNAGGTGKSYHADRRAKNQQQRVHYLIQAGWNAASALQGFGRTHRSNEVSQPIFKLVSTNIPGQKRFITTIAKRLDQAGALTKGQRQASGGVFSARDNLESDLAADVLSSYYAQLSPDTLKKIGLYDALYDKDGNYNRNAAAARDVPKFLNRILALGVEEQTEVFDGFDRQRLEATDRAIANGTIDTGLENKLAEKIDVVGEQVIRKDSSGAETKYVELSAYSKPALVSYEFCSSSDNFVGMYRINDTGAVVAVSKASDYTNRYTGAVQKRFRLQTPVRTQYSHHVESSLEKIATKLPKVEWRSAWETETANAPEFVENTIHMLTGTLLPIWDKLPQENTRVMRVISKETGQTFIGRILSEEQTDTVLNHFQKQREMRIYTTLDIRKHILDGDTATLSRDNAKIIRRRVSGEWRMEYIGYNAWNLNSIPGIIRETIQSKPRWFIATGEAGLPVLEAVLKKNPLSSFKQEKNYDETEYSRRIVIKPSPDKWTAAHANTPGTAVKPLSQIVADIRVKYDIPITTGHIRASGVVGQYDRIHEGVRSRVTNDLPTIAHELGHHFDKLYSIRESLSGEQIAELVSRLDPEISAKYKSSQLTAEGIAEFVREYLTDMTTASKRYPEFYKSFPNLLTVEDMKSIDAFADEINAYMATSRSYTDIGVHDIGEKPKDLRPLPSKAEDAADWFAMKATDSNQGIRRFTRFTGDRSAYFLATNAAYADNRAAAIITGELSDIHGNPLGVSLRGALSGIHLNQNTEYKDFGAYLVLRHGPERLKEGLRVFADNTMNTEDWMNEQREIMEQKYPAFADAAEKLYEFQRTFLRAWAVDTHLISHETADNWEKRWSQYVPFNRHFDNSTPGSARLSYANQKDPFHRAFGSGREFQNPVDSIMTNIVKTVNTAIRNQVMLTITDSANATEASARFLEKVPPPLHRTVISTEGFKQELGNELSAAKLTEDDSNTVFGILSGMDEFLTQYGAGKKGYGDVVTVIRDGKQEFYKINDPILLESVANLSPSNRSEVLTAYGKISKFITGNITGMNVVWSIFSNFPRDLGTLFTFSPDRNPIHIFGNMGNGYANAFKKQIGMKVDPLYEKFLSMGGGSTSAYSSDSKSIRALRGDLRKTRLRYFNPLEHIGFLSDMIEKGPRFAVFKSLIEQGYSAERAFYEAMDVTTNFRRSGTWAKQINNAIPFFNAGVQGVDKFRRWITAEDAPSSSRAKVVTGRTTAYITASAIMAALMAFLNYRDEDDRENYIQLSAYTKNAYWCIPLGAGQYFTITKPRELAVLSSLMQTSMERYLLDNPHAFDGFYDYAATNFLPNGLAEIAQLDGFGAIGSLGIVGVGAYMMANRDFLGKPIVSQSLSLLMPKDQYDRTTSKIAVSVGQALNLSPKMIDYFFNNTLGGFWKYQKALFPVGEENIDKWLGVRNQYFKSNLYSTDVVNRMYDTMKSLSAQHNSNPDDMSITLAFKKYDTMTSFYSKYAQLSRSQSDTEERRMNRQVIIDMIMEMDKAPSNEMAALERLCTSLGSTSLFPSVMQSTVSETKRNVKTEYPLNDIQYTEYQLQYNTLYWKYVGESLSRTDLDDERMQRVVQKAKNRAKEEADEWILERVNP